MNNDDRKNAPHPGDTRAEDTVARLMELAGPRAEIASERQRRVHENVYQSWRQSTRVRTTYRWAVPLALAASVILAVNINTNQPAAPVLSVGHIAYVAGASNRYASGDPVYAGEVLQTTALGGMSVALPGDISLRLAANTSVRIENAGELTLVEGLMYADTGDRIYREQHLTVHTEAGSATDIGTQFSLNIADNQLAVAVREGRVDVAANNSVHTAIAGEKLTIEPGNVPQRAAVLPFDDSWTWASELAPGFDISNRSLMDFLKWAARETGRELVFAKNELRIAAMNAKLFGSIDDFTPAEAIESVMSTTRFKYRVDESSITITE